MSFFTNFPVIDYYFDPKSQSTHTLRHIIRRFKVDDLVKNNVLTYQKYLIADGDTPDTVSYKFYGRADWHWIILMFNDIINPFRDWPRASHLVLQDARLKYNVTRTATFTANSINFTVNDATNLYVGAKIWGTGIPDELYITAINGTTISTNLVSTFSGVKTVKIDTIFANHHIENSKGIVVDTHVYAGLDLVYVRNIDYENKLNDRYRVIKMPLKAHAQAIDREATTILAGT